jgi:hypothetical protein
MEASTKKFPSALTAEGFASSRSTFVIPSLDGGHWFVDLRTGKKHETAYLVYLGTSITAEDVLQKLSNEPTDLVRARNLINSLIGELNRFKIGNVVAVEHSDGENVKLRLVANAPRSRPGPKLPG